MAKTAIYICDCKGLISEHVDTRSLEQMARSLEDVSLVERVGTLCREEDLTRMAARLAEADVDRLIVAACSPRMSLQLPEQRLVTAAKQGGIDPCLVEVANIREQCAWVHRDNREGASRKARDLLRMAHARVCASEPALKSVALERRALVVGAGSAGLAAARSLASAGIAVTLVEQQAHVGGTLCQLPFMFQTECWPATCESSCIGPVQAAEVLLDPLVDLHTESRIEHLSQHQGNFQVRIRRAPRYVDADQCFSCGLCEQVCPEETENAFELRRTTRKAISKPFPRAVPDTFTLLEQACTFCGECVEVCPTRAIDLEAQEERWEETVGAVILSTGSTLREPQELLGLPNVVTALEFERILAAGLARPSDGEAPEHVIFVQCAGSRVSMDSDRAGVSYCSKTCCSVTAKQAKRLATSFPQTEVSVVYYRDFRTYERALEKLHQDLRAMGITFVNGEVTDIAASEEDTLAVKLDLLGTEELEMEGESGTVEGDLVVLACAQQPRLPDVALGLGFPTDAFGFPIESQPRILRPTETFVDRVFAIGAAQGPKTIQHSVEQGATAALKTAQALSAAEKQPGKFVCQVDSDLCSSCRVCLSVCPHGAMSMGAAGGGASSDPAFCQGCGMCAASCSSHAAQIRNFSDELLLSEARCAFEEAAAGEPRLLALVCYWCGYGGVDLAGVEGLSLPDCLRIMRIRCSSSVNLGLVLEMFRMGIDGIIVAGCPHHSCHHMWGNWLADRRTGLMRNLMQQMGLDERRLVFENIGLMHAKKFADLVRRKRDELLALGPNPLARRSAVVQGAAATWLAR